jgi:hypothetical protein
MDRCPVLLVTLPKVELFQKDLNFQFEPQAKEDKVIIRNTHPIAG